MGIFLTGRWREWDRVEPFWSRLALALMISSLLSLGLHLSFFLGGFVTGVALITMILFASLAELIFIWRKQTWWALFWGVWVMGGVALWEIASYLWK